MTNPCEINYTHRKPFQFSLAILFLLIAIVAVLLALNPVPAPSYIYDPEVGPKLEYWPRNHAEP